MIIAFFPFIIGIISRFLIPVVEDLLTDYFGVGTTLTPYYDLFDLFLIIVTPAMLNFMVAMVMFEDFLMMSGLALAGRVQGIVIALLILTLSKNKVEGLVMGKMTTLFIPILVVL